MSRLHEAFDAARGQGRAALVAYLMAGDPDLPASESLALACIRGGADVLELGLPFSDPIADGPEIQRAGQRALRGGTRPRDVLELVGRLRGRTDAPLVVMSYVNPILAMGLEDFARSARDAGVDGLIVPDLSMEESAEVRSSLDACGIDHIQLVAPSTSPDRARAVAAASRGFLYVVARYGTTGTRENLPPELPSRLQVLRSVTDLPLAVGFGVTTPDHVRALRRAGADGIVVGSAIVRRIGESADPAGVESFVAELARGLRADEVTSPVPRGSSP